MRFGVDIVGPFEKGGTSVWKVGAFAQYEEAGKPSAGRILEVVLTSNNEAERVALEIRNLIKAVEAATTVEVTANK